MRLDGYAGDIDPKVYWEEDLCKHLTKVYKELIPGTTTSPALYSNEGVLTCAKGKPQPLPCYSGCDKKRFS